MWLSRNKLLILSYHRVLPDPDPLRPAQTHLRSFEAQLAALQRGFNVLPLTVAVEQMREGRLPPRAVAITFDDGYKDNVTIAMPALRRRGLSATFFIATGYLNGLMWNDTIIESVRAASGDTLDLGGLGMGTLPIGSVTDKRRTIAAIIEQLKYREPDDRLQATARVRAIACEALDLSLMMSPEDLCTLLNAGMELGAHTVTHPILSNVSVEDARREILESMHALESITGTPVTSFAYPNGRPDQDYGREHVRLLSEAGIQFAVSTAPGLADQRSDPLQLPRLAAWGDNGIRFMLRLLKEHVVRDPATAARAAVQIDD